MKMTRRSVLVAPAVLLASGVALADETDGLLARIAIARARLRTLQGPFTQVRRIGLLASDVRSSGRLSLLRPDRLRWELSRPDSITFWVGPEGIAYRSPHGGGRLPHSRATSALDDLRALLGGDVTTLKQRWSLDVRRDDTSGVELAATALGASSAGAARTVRLTLALDLVRPSRIVLVEGPKDWTTIDFTDLEVDAPLDERMMSY